MAYIWNGFWNQSTCDFRLLYGLVCLLRFILQPGLCKRDQCNTAEAAVASDGWWILRLKAWNVVLDREKCWTIELFIGIVLFLDLEAPLADWNIRQHVFDRLAILHISSTASIPLTAVETLHHVFPHQHKNTNTVPYASCFDQMHC